MLRELTGVDWLAALGLEPDQIPDVLLLRGTRNLRRHYLRHEALFENVVELGSPNALFEDVFVGMYRGVKVGYASVYGPAMASEITHVFGVLGTPVVIQTGVCGGLQDGGEAGDLIVASSAGCGDGAAACYRPGIAAVDATPEIVSWVRHRASGGVPCHVGPIWTTAALLAEGEADLMAWRDAGYLAVDMETATTFAVAEHYGMRRVSVLSVFDNPLAGSHLGMTEAHKDEARAAGEDASLALVLSCIVHESSGAEVMHS